MSGRQLSSSVSLEDMARLGGRGREKAPDEAADLLLRILTFPREAASQLHGHIAPYDSPQWLRGTAHRGLLRWVAVHHTWGLCSAPMDVCAIFVFFFSYIYSVYVVTPPEAISTETLPLFPWHIFALRDECSFHQGMCV